MEKLPLTKPNRILLARAFRQVPRVDLAIECVIEGQMGAAFVDDRARPKAFLIRIGPFHYLAGDPASEGGRTMASELEPHGLIMAVGPGWIEALRNIHGEKLNRYSRYRFSSESLSLKHLEGIWNASPWKGHVRRFDLDLSKKIWNEPGLVDISDFDSAADFQARGIGYGVMQNGRLVGAAYSSLVCSQGIEISLVVEDDFRRQGMATAISYALLRWCLKNNMEPHWDAGNKPSRGLALKLGYTFLGEYDLHLIAE